MWIKHPDRAALINLKKVFKITKSVASNRKCSIMFFEKYNPWNEEKCFWDEWSFDSELERDEFFHMLMTQLTVFIK